MSENIEGLSIVPDMDCRIRRIHPAIGIVDGLAYVGKWIFCNITDPEKGRKSYQEKLFIINEKGERILANDELLAQRGWALTNKPVKVFRGWSLESVKAHLADPTAPFDPGALVTDLLNQTVKYVEFVSMEGWDNVQTQWKPIALLQAIWGIGTFFARTLFNAYPYNFLTGTKRTAKTKLLTLLAATSFNSVFSSDISTASLYRLIQNGGSTLFMDETERLNNPERAQDMKTALNAGYKQGQYAVRVEKNRREELVPESFDLYSAKALANIRGLEDVLEDRCIVTVMRRGLDRKIVDREIDLLDPIWQELRDRMYLLFLKCWREVKAAYGEVSECSEDVNIVGDMHTLEHLRARELELWRPILALAKYIANTTFTCTLCSPCSHGSVFKCMLQLAARLSQEKHFENLAESADMILTQVLLRNVTADDFYAVKTIKDWAAEAYDEEQKWLNTKWVGNALRRLGFKEKRRVRVGYEYHLTKTAVKELAQRLQIEPDEVEDDKKPKPEGLDPYTLHAKLFDKLLDHTDKEGQIDRLGFDKDCKELGVEPEHILQQFKDNNLVWETSGIWRRVR